MFLRDSHHCFRREAGFSLIEVMVVMVIIGLMTTAAVTLIPSSDRPDVMAAERSVALLQQIRRQSIVTGGIVGVSIQNGDLDVAVFSSGTWKLAEDETFTGLDAFLRGAELSVANSATEPTTERSNSEFVPDIWFLPTGEHLPFQITKHSGSGADTYSSLTVSGETGKPIQLLIGN